MEKCIKTNTLENLCEITCKQHHIVNSKKGVIFAPYLKDVPESEIIQEIKEQGITDVYKFAKLVDDELTRKPIEQFVLTFDLYRLPTKNCCSIGEGRRRYRENNPVTSVKQTASFSFTVKNNKHNIETSPSISDNQPSTSKKIQNLINSKTSHEKQSLAETNEPTASKNLRYLPGNSSS